MPFLVLTIGLVLVITSIRDTYAQFGAQLRSDLTGPQNFTQYALALSIVGAFGYSDKLRPASNLFMALIIISLILSNRGFFNKFAEAIKAGPAAIPTPAGTPHSGPDLSTNSALPGMPDLTMPGVSSAIGAP